MYGRGWARAGMWELYAEHHATDARVVDRWAAMRSSLINQLKGEGINDLWVASCCLVHDLPLVTNNLSDYQTIAALEPALQLVHPDL